MATNQYSVEIAGVDLAGQNHVCAFFNNMDEEHRVLRSFYNDGFDRGEKATHIEARLNHVLSRYSDPVICNYDLSKFSASVAMDIMRTHPLVIVGGLLRENPFFVPPDQFLTEIRQRRASRTTAG
jgi:hypothetical protein